MLVDMNIFVNSTACNCRNPKLLCDRVILESKDRNFTVRALSADREGDQGLGSWDLSTFRLPRSDKFEKAVRNENVKTLELKFTDFRGTLLQCIFPSCPEAHQP